MARSVRLDVNLRVLKGREGDSDDRDAEWLKVFRHYDPRLRSFFVWRFASEDELEDHLAALWARAFLFVGSLKSPAALWSWLTTIGNNVFHDEQRRRTRRPQLLESEMHGHEGALEVLIAGWTADIDESDQHREEASVILDALDAEDREFLELYAVDGLSHEEIARRLGLPSAAASRQRLRRIRLRLTRSDEG